MPGIRPPATARKAIKLHPPLREVTGALIVRDDADHALGGQLLMFVDFAYRIAASAQSSQTKSGVRACPATIVDVQKSATRSTLGTARNHPLPSGGNHRTCHPFLVTTGLEVTRDLRRPSFWCPFLSLDDPDCV